MSRAKRTPLSGQDKTRWREKVREECMQRVKQHRRSVLWRMRQVSRFSQPLLVVSSDGRRSALGCMQRIRQQRWSAIGWTRHRTMMLTKFASRNMVFLWKYPSSATMSGLPGLAVAYVRQMTYAAA